MCAYFKLTEGTTSLSSIGRGWFLLVHWLAVVTTASQWGWYNSIELLRTMQRAFPIVRYRTHFIREPGLPL